MCFLCFYSLQYSLFFTWRVARRSLNDVTKSWTKLQKMLSTFPLSVEKCLLFNITWYFCTKALSTGTSAHKLDFLYELCLLTRIQYCRMLKQFYLLTIFTWSSTGIFVIQILA